MLNDDRLVLSASMQYTFTRDPDGLFTLVVYNENECFDASLLTKLSMSCINSNTVVMVEYDGLVFEFLPTWNCASEKAFTMGAYCLVGKNAKWPRELGEATVTFTKESNGKYMCNLPQLATFCYGYDSRVTDFDHGKSHFSFERLFTDGVEQVLRETCNAYTKWEPVKYMADVDAAGDITEDTFNEISNRIAHYYPDKTFGAGLRACLAKGIIEFRYDTQAQDDKSVKACCAWQKKHNKKN